MLVAASVFVFTLILVIWQPKGLGVGWSASAGALIELAVGAVSLQDIPAV
jgi:arsenical pump membrane protein